MKNLVLFVCCLVAVSTGLWAQPNYDFSAESTSGHTLFYKINSNKTSVRVVSEKSIQPHYTTKPTGNLTIPEQVVNDGKTYAVTAIGDQAFYSCSGLTSVSMPNSITEIGSNAFYYCIGLTSITIPNTVTTISKYAFSWCTALTSCSIPNTVISMGNDVFQNTAWLDSQADGIIYKDNWCLGYKGSKPTGAVSIQEGTKGIAACAFNLCSEITEITIPNSVITIGEYAFQKCTGLTTINLPEALTYIEWYAFKGCSTLTSFTIPNAVTNIGRDVFTNTAWYDNQDDGILYKDGWCLCYKGSKPTGSITIQEGTKGIANNVFHSCSGITDVTFPSTLTNINNFAFGYCSGITSIVCEALTPPTMDSVAFANKYDATLTVHASSLQAYQNAPWWKKFTIQAFSYTVTATSTDENMGSVTGSGTYTEDATATLTAIPVAHHHFVQWNDGNDQNPRIFNVDSNTTLTATFEIDSYTLSADVNDENMGSIEITDEARSYVYGTEITVTATPADHHHFVQWNDGNDQNPRIFNIDSNTTLTAIFEIDSYTLSADVNDENMGSVEITDEARSYAYGTEITVTATPADHHHFVQWNDGNEQNPRIFNIDSNTTLTAIFEIDSYTLSVGVNDENMGSVEITDEARSYVYGTEITVTATPADHHHFVQWNDGNEQNPRIFNIDSNTTLTAIFEIDSYTLSVGVNDENMGSVEITDEARSYVYGTEITVTATPAEGYQFVNWSDDEEAGASRTITITEDMEITANFERIPEGPDAITEASSSNAQIFGSNQRIVINNAANANVAVYDVMGREVVKAQRITTNREVLAVPQQGMYIVRVGKTAKKVWVK